jgi:hypothetical protein
LDAEELGVKETLDVAQRKLYILRKSLKPARPKEWSLTALSVARLAEGENGLVHLLLNLKPSSPGMHFFVSMFVIIKLTRCPVLTIVVTDLALQQVLAI